MTSAVIPLLALALALASSATALDAQLHTPCAAVSPGMAVSFFRPTPDGLLQPLRTRTLLRPGGGGTRLRAPAEQVLPAAYPFEPRWGAVVEGVADDVASLTGASLCGDGRCSVEASEATGRFRVTVAAATAAEAELALPAGIVVLGHCASRGGDPAADPAPCAAAETAPGVTLRVYRETAPRPGALAEVRTAEALDMTVGTSGTPAAGVPPNGWSAHFDGALVPNRTGWHEISLEAAPAEDARLWVGGGAGGLVLYGGSSRTDAWLEAGRAYAVHAELVDEAGAAFVRALVDGAIMVPRRCPGPVPRCAGACGGGRRARGLCVLGGAPCWCEPGRGGDACESPAAGEGLVPATAVPAGAPGVAMRVYHGPNLAVPAPGAAVTVLPRLDADFATADFVPGLSPLPAAFSGQWSASFRFAVAAGFDADDVRLECADTPGECALARGAGPRDMAAELYDSRGGRVRARLYFGSTGETVPPEALELQAGDSDDGSLEAVPDGAETGGLVVEVLPAAVRAVHRGELVHDFGAGHEGARADGYLVPLATGWHVLEARQLEASSATSPSLLRLVVGTRVVASAAAPVHLRAGRAYPLRVDVALRSGASGRVSMALLWSPPGGVRAPVPPEALAFGDPLALGRNCDSLAGCSAASLQPGVCVAGACVCLGGRSGPTCAEPAPRVAAPAPRNFTSRLALDACAATAARRPGLDAAVEWAGEAAALAAPHPDINFHDVISIVSGTELPVRYAWSGRVAALPAHRFRLVKVGVMFDFVARLELGGGGGGGAVAALASPATESEALATPAGAGTGGVALAVELNVTNAVTLGLALEWSADGGGTWEPVPPDALAHDVACGSAACEAAGCCVGDDQCACAPGTAGAGCGLVCAGGSRAAEGFAADADVFATVEEAVDSGWYRLELAGVAADAAGVLGVIVDGFPTRPVYDQVATPPDAGVARLGVPVFLEAGRHTRVRVDTDGTLAAVEAVWTPAGGAVRVLRLSPECNDTVASVPEAGQCVAANGTLAVPGTPCDAGGDADACTGGGECVFGGACLPPVANARAAACTETASVCEDPAAGAGECDAGTGECSYAPLAAGSSCAADVASSCLELMCDGTGSCTPAAGTFPDPTRCLAGFLPEESACRAASCGGVEDADCVVTVLPDGAACSLGLGCFDDGAAECRAGVCTAPARSCDGFAGACETASCEQLANGTGGCVAEPVSGCDPERPCAGRPDGTPCDADGLGCTALDRCSGGECVAGAALACGAADSPTCAVASCEEGPNGTASCVTAPRDGAAGADCDADTGLSCVTGAVCAVNGTCVPGDTPVTCADLPGPWASAECVEGPAGVCSEAAGGCQWNFTAEGTACGEPSPCRVTACDGAGRCAVVTENACVHGTCLRSGCRCDITDDGVWFGTLCDELGVPPSFTLPAGPLEAVAGSAFSLAEPADAAGTEPLVWRTAAGGSAVFRVPSNTSGEVVAGDVPPPASRDSPTLLLRLEASNEFGSLAREVAVTVVQPHAARADTAEAGGPNGDTLTVRGTASAEGVAVDVWVFAADSGHFYPTGAAGAAAAGLVTGPGGAFEVTFDAPPGGRVLVGASSAGWPVPSRPLDDFDAETLVYRVQLNGVPAEASFVPGARSLVLGGLELRNRGASGHLVLGAAAGSLAPPLAAVEVAGLADAPVGALFVLEGVNATVAVSPSSSARSALAPLRLALSVLDGTGVARATAERETLLAVPPARAALGRAEPQALGVVTASAVRGGPHRLVEFGVASVGGSDATALRVVLPAGSLRSWVSVVSPRDAAHAEGLAPGSEARVTLRLAPGAGVEAGAYRGRLFVAHTGGELEVPFEFEVALEGVGDLAVAVEDEYTYWSAPDYPLVAGATVELRGAFATSEVVASAVTGPNGTAALAGVPAGLYELRVSAPGHRGSRGPVEVLAGRTSSVDVFLQRTTVSYEWSVTAGSYEDSYLVSVDALFETHVPAPVVSCDPPMVDVATIRCANASVVVFNCTNHGLVTALEFELVFGPVGGCLFEPLVETRPVGNLPARSSVYIPVRVGCEPDTDGVYECEGPPLLGRGTVGAAPPGGDDDDDDDDSSGGGGVVTGGGGGGGSGGGGGCLDFLMLWKLLCGSIRSYQDLLPVNATGCPRLYDGGTWSCPLDGSCGSPGSVGGRGAISSGLIRAVPGRDTKECRPPCLPTLETLGKCLFFLSPIPPFIKRPSSASLIGSGWYNAATAGDSGFDNAVRAVSTAAWFAASRIPGPVKTAWGALMCAKLIAEDLQKCSNAQNGLNGGPGTHGPGGPGTGGGGGLLGGDGGGGGSVGAAAAWAQRAPTALDDDDAEGLYPDIVSLITSGDVALRRVNHLFDVLLLVFDDAAWFETEDDALWRALVDALADGSEAGAQISPAEETALAAIAADTPPPLSGERVAAFVARWQLSFDRFHSGSPDTEGSIDFPAYVDALDEFHTNVTLEFEREGAATVFDLLEETRDAVDRRLNGPAPAGVCAQVRIRIEQAAVLLLQEFDASFSITNGDLAPISALNVSLYVRAADGAAVPEGAFTVTAAADDDGGATSTVPVGGTASFSWTVRPNDAAAPDTDSREYFIGGTLSYVLGDATPVEVPLAEDRVVVRAPPDLRLRYFFSRDVYGDDPFTDDVVEPPQPFSLGVLVGNEGRGTAEGFRIESAQPQIVDNDKGLAVEFGIVGSQVGDFVAEDSAVAPTLTADFGDLGPGQYVAARWVLVSTLQGRFIDYEATLAHGGGDETAGDDEPRPRTVSEVSVHELVRAVDLGAASLGQPAFLVNDLADPSDMPDTVHVAGQTTVPVLPVRLLAAGSDAAIAGASTVGLEALHVDLNLTAAFAAASNSSIFGWRYVRMHDPVHAGPDGPVPAARRGLEPVQYRLTGAKRLPDGDVVPVGTRAWTTYRTYRVTDGGGIVEEARLHLLLRVDGVAGELRLTYTSAPPDDPCDGDPCFPGSACTATEPAAGGFSCGPCPPGFAGDGVSCALAPGCESDPCADGFNCTDIPEPASVPAYTCGECPPGVADDGTGCVNGTSPPPAGAYCSSLASPPCYRGVACVELAAAAGLVSCGPCPPPLLGDGVVCEPEEFMSEGVSYRVVFSLDEEYEAAVAPDPAAFGADVERDVCDALGAGTCDPAAVRVTALEPGSVVVTLDLVPADEFSPRDAAAELFAQFYSAGSPLLSGARTGRAKQDVPVRVFAVPSEACDDGSIRVDCSQEPLASGGESDVGGGGGGGGSGAVAAVVTVLVLLAVAAAIYFWWAARRRRSGKPAAAGEEGGSAEVGADGTSRHLGQMQARAAAAEGEVEIEMVAEEGAATAEPQPLRLHSADGADERDSAALEL